MNGSCSCARARERESVCVRERESTVNARCDRYGGLITDSHDVSMVSSLPALFVCMYVCVVCMSNVR